MNTHLTYILVDFFCIIFPLLFSFHPKIKFNSQVRYFLGSCFTTSFLFITWDFLFTHYGIWSFNEKYVLGVYLLNLPIEEVLFFFCIPYACVFTYYCLDLFLALPGAGKSFFRGIKTFAFLLLVIGSLFFNKYYTSLTCISLSGVLFLMAYRKETFINRFLLSYAVILLPFFISNGLLTGAFTAEPVVIYNDHYNLGLRMFTIPIEDLFYGMLLLLLNVRGYEYAKLKIIKSKLSTSDVSNV